METAVLKLYFSPESWLQALSSGFHYLPRLPDLLQLVGTAPGPVLPSLHLCINPAEVSISELSFPNFKINFQSQTNAFGKYNKSKMSEK